MTDTQPRDHRRVIRIDPQTIAALIELPEGAHIASIRGVWDPATIEILVIDPTFTPVDPYAASPCVGAMATVNDCGRVHLAYDYERERA